MILFYSSFPNLSLTLVHHFTSLLSSLLSSLPSVRILLFSYSLFPIFLSSCPSVFLLFLSELTSSSLPLHSIFISLIFLTILSYFCFFLFFLSFVVFSFSVIIFPPLSHSFYLNSMFFLFPVSPSLLVPFISPYFLPSFLFVFLFSFSVIILPRLFFCFHYVLYCTSSVSLLFFFFYSFS